MSDQGSHTNICCLEELFTPWSAFIQDQHHDQQQLMIHQGVNISTSNAHELFPQENDIEQMGALMIQEQRYDQYQLISYEGANTGTNIGHKLFPQPSAIETSYFSITQGSA